MEHYDGPVFLRRQQKASSVKVPQRQQTARVAAAPRPVVAPKRRAAQAHPVQRPTVDTHRFTPKYIPQPQQPRQSSDEELRLAQRVQALAKTTDSYLLFSTAAPVETVAAPEVAAAPTFLLATEPESTLAVTATAASSDAAAVTNPSQSVAVGERTSTEASAEVEASTEAEASSAVAEASTEIEASTVDEANTEVEASTADEANTVDEASTEVEASTVDEVSAEVEASTADEVSAVAEASTEVEPSTEAASSATPEGTTATNFAEVDTEAVNLVSPESAAVAEIDSEAASTTTAATSETPSWRHVVAAVVANTPPSAPIKPASPAAAQTASAAPAPTMHQAANTVGDSHDAKPQLTIKEQAPLDDQHYQLPPFSLLPEPVKDSSSEMKAWVEQQRVALNETLKAFNVQATVSRWSIGPAVTQFEISLSRGVKVSKITNLSDDLKLALAAKDIRIEAPIPGKSTVGIEIPNLKSRPVMLSEVVESAKFQESKSPLTVALGVDLFGQPMITNVGKMPHGLIAGATGSGKSVFINSLLLSILFKAKPSEVKLLLIDPKAVELAPYNGLPHLLSPVISDPKAAAAALKWAVDEMENRYTKLAAAGVRNLEQFNAKADARKEYGLKIPYIVIIIDELADLMMVASSEVQDYIVRITQKARAAGIHLLVATQRPSVDVVTGTIKNNIPTRIAFMVSSQIDSRTIIDQGGAERLLGRGDMLYLGNGQSQPIRIQGTYAESEIDPIVDFVKQQLPPHYLFEPDSLLEKVEATENQDELFPEALAYIADEAQVSTSKLQRVFSIGYNRAANLIDTLEQRKLISPASGSKPRDVYFTPEDLIKYQESKQAN